MRNRENSVDNRKRVIAVIGPTASGKTALALALARKLGGEVISADSRQVYQDMDIGTAKATKEERRGIPHHLLDVTTPDKQYTVADYVRAAREAIDDITSRGKLPIVCGGTTFYLDALFARKNIPAVPPNQSFRKTLEHASAEELYERLRKLDPRRAGDIDPQNKRRLIRALEIVHETGKPVPAPRSGNESESPYRVIFLAPQRTREELKERIRERVYERWDGIVKETKRLHETYRLSWEKLDSFGLEYRYATRYILEKLSAEAAQARLVAATWRYAKKQLAWCAKRPVRHLSLSDVDRLSGEELF